jgi:hypothetical protein
LQIADVQSYVNQLKYVLDNCFKDAITGSDEVRTLKCELTNVIARFVAGPPQTIQDAQYWCLSDDLRALIWTQELMLRVTTRGNAGSIWKSYEARSYIQSFCNDVRAIFDYALSPLLQIHKAKFATGDDPLTKLCRKQSQKLKDVNFAEFRGLVLNNSEKTDEYFGASFGELVRKCNWFADVNGLRNNIVHNGIFISTSPDNPDDFRFELFTESSGAGQNAEVSHPLNEVLPEGLRGATASNSASFRVFSGLYGGLLLFFLEQWAKEISQLQSIIAMQHNPNLSGATTCESNIKLALGLLQGLNSGP